MANNAKAVDTHMAVLLSYFVSMEFVDSFEERFHSDVYGTCLELQ